MGQRPPSHTIGPPLRGVGALAADFYLRTGYMPLKRNGTQPRRSRLLLHRAQIRALVAYVASLGKGPAIPTPHPERGNLSQGQQLFADNCAGCHQIAARGRLRHARACRRRSATPPPADRRGGAHRPVCDAALLASSDHERTAGLARPLREWTKHPDDRGGWAIGRIGPVPEGLVTWFLAAAALVGTLPR